MSTREAAILLVEDEQNVGLTLVDLLAADGYRVKWAKSLEDARSLLVNSSFDLILLDIMLPDGDGFQLADELRLQPGHQAAIIFLSALGSTDDRIRGLETGAEDYIVKPFHLKELRLRIKNVLRSRIYLHSGTQKIRIGKAEISFTKFQAIVDDCTISLTQKECTLLKLLVENQNSVISRDTILDQVWSQDEFPSPRTVDNFIVKLRKIVEDEPHQPKHIKSIRGIGYQLSL